jgi:hypothetical protein
MRQTTKNIAQMAKSLPIWSQCLQREKTSVAVNWNLQLLRLLHF